jgi:hypothetical protein
MTRHLGRVPLRWDHSSETIFATGRFGTGNALARAPAGPNGPMGANTSLVG